MNSAAIKETRVGETLGALRRSAIARLQTAGIVSPELDVRVLLRHALEVDDASLVAASDRLVSQKVQDRFEGWLHRRISGEPVARIVGFKEFWSRAFKVGLDTLVPRPDSEIIVEAALAAFPDCNLPLRVLDLGTGAGILLASILLEMKNSTGIGIDRSADALAIARDNLDVLGAGERAKFICGDWGSALGLPFDLVVANPPYIRSDEISKLSREVHEHDPCLALDGGADGLCAYRAIVTQLPHLLSVNGIAVLELGLGQEQAVTKLARDAGLFATGPARRDLAGVPRALVLMTTSENNTWNSPRSALVSGTDST